MISRIRASTRKPGTCTVLFTNLGKYMSVYRIKAACIPVFVLSLLVLVYAGCKTSQPYNTEQPLYGDTLWRAQATQDLAYDYRCDGIFDFEALCASGPTQTRLEALKNVPEHVMVPLRERAVEINTSWDGD
jgi:hypothetical protein